MKEIFVAMIVAVVVSASAYAFTSTWKTPTNSAVTSTLGENEKLEKQKANITELRDQMHKIRQFVGYSSQNPAW